MKYELVFSRYAEKDLKKIPLQTALRVVEKLEFFVAHKNPLDFAIKLSGTKDKYRFRIGSYRVIFEVGSRKQIKLLMILKVADRKDIYE